MRQKKIKKMGETLIIRLLMNINCMTCSDLLKSRQTWKVLDSCLHTHVKQCLKGMLCSAVVGSRVWDRCDRSGRERQLWVKGSQDESTRTAALTSSPPPPGAECQKRPRHSGEDIPLHRHHVYTASGRRDKIRTCWCQCRRDWVEYMLTHFYLQ